MISDGGTRAIVRGKEVHEEEAYRKERRPIAPAEQYTATSPPGTPENPRESGYPLSRQNPSREGEGQTAVVTGDSPREISC